MLSLNEIQELVGRQASFDEGQFERPPRKHAVTGVIKKVYLQKEGDNNDHTRKVPAHVRVEIGVGNVTHNIAWSHVRVVRP